MSWWYSPLYKIMWRFCTVNTLFLYSIHLFLYGIHFIFVRYTLYFCTVYTLFLYSIHLFLYSIHFIFVQYTLIFVHYTLYFCTVYTLFLWNIVASSEVLHNSPIYIRARIPYRLFPYFVQDCFHGNTKY